VTARLCSVNVGRATPGSGSGRGGPGVTGIDKRPVAGPARISDPGPKGSGASGVAGDAVCDLRHHGGTDQAVYAYAREDLDAWQALLGRELGHGAFGENLTTAGLDVTGALIGERWGIGDECVLEVTGPRLPCRTFAAFLAERSWVRRFSERGAPGAYLRVLRPGTVAAGDPIEVLERPRHDVTIGLAFAALNGESSLLPRLRQAGAAVPADIVRAVERDERRAAAAASAAAAAARNGAGGGSAPPPR
jgi:MOSC domain-containing protein YiiM